jgi:hypothetical protein
VKRIGFALFVCIVGAGPAWAAVDCPAEITPAFAAPGEPPNYRIWQKKNVPLAALAACTDWGAWKPTLVAALAGEFRYEGPAEGLLARLGAISSLTTVKYWSVTEGKWKQLITAASALKGSDGWERRSDFTATELSDGKPRHFIQYDNRSTGGSVYRMQATDVGKDALRVTVRNTSAVSFFFVTAYEPGDLRSVHVLRPAGKGVWRYFGLAGLRGGSLGGIGKSSAVNRAVAMYRHLARLPTDGAPPVMRD